MLEILVEKNAWNFSEENAKKKNAWDFSEENSKKTKLEISVNDNFDFHFWKRTVKSDQKKFLFETRWAKFWQKTRQNYGTRYLGKLVKKKFWDTLFLTVFWEKNFFFWPKTFFRRKGLRSAPLRPFRRKKFLVRKKKIFFSEHGQKACSRIFFFTIFQDP